MNLDEVKLRNFMSCSRSCTFKHQSQGLGPENGGYFPSTSPYTGTSFLLPVQLPPHPPPPPRPLPGTALDPPSSASLSARGSSDAQLAQLPPPGTQFASLIPTHFSGLSSNVTTSRKPSLALLPKPGSLVIASHGILWFFIDLDITAIIHSPSCE